jgi:hypothetical protein
LGPRGSLRVHTLPMPTVHPLTLFPLRAQIYNPKDIDSAVAGVRSRTLLGGKTSKWARPNVWNRSAGPPPPPAHALGDFIFWLVWCLGTWRWAGVDEDKERALRAQAASILTLLGASDAEMPPGLADNFTIEHCAGSYGVRGASRALDTVGCGVWVWVACECVCVGCVWGGGGGGLIRDSPRRHVGVRWGSGCWVAGLLGCLACWLFGC